MSNRSLNLLIAAVLLVYLAGSLLLCGTRPIDGDEGYYAAAARLVAEGESLYVDFFYPQTPLMPIIYAPVYTLVGSSLVAMRYASAVFGAWALLFWALFLRRRFGDSPAIVVAGLLAVAMNPYFLVWNVTVKTTALTGLCVFAALWALDRGMEARQTRFFVFAGLAAGQCVGIRALFGPWAALLLLYFGWRALRRGDAEVRGRDWWSLVVGAVVGFAPVLVIFARGPDAFLFSAYRYHTLRAIPLQKAGMLPSGFGHVVDSLQTFAAALLTNPFMMLQLLLAGAGVWALVKGRVAGYRTLLLFSLAGFVVHGLAGFVPNPAYEQYFTAPLTPMLAPLVVAGLVVIARRGRGALAGVLVCGLLLSVVDLAVLDAGMDDDELWRLDHYERVVDGIESMTGPDDAVMAFWPGYVFESDRQFIPGMENHFGVEISELLTLEEKVDYHIVGKELILAALDKQIPAMVITGAWMNGLHTGIEQRHLPVIVEELNRKYEESATVGEVQLCLRRTVAAPVSPAE